MGPARLHYTRLPCTVLCYAIRWPPQPLARFGGRPDRAGGWLGQPSGYPARQAAARATGLWGGEPPKVSEGRPRLPAGGPEDSATTEISGFFSAGCRSCSKKRIRLTTEVIQQRVLSYPTCNITKHKKIVKMFLTKIVRIICGVPLNRVIESCRTPIHSASTIIASSILCLPRMLCMQGGLKSFCVRLHDVYLSARASVETTLSGLHIELSVLIPPWW